jgi:riboflavin synthase
MFTGIIECLGKVESIKIDGLNKHFKITSPISNQLKIDQSVSHDGVCLTVTGIENDSHWVTAIHETLLKSNLNSWTVGTEINLERCLKLGDRLDGHWVQGHVDTTGICSKIIDENGSWKYEIEYINNIHYRTIQKGSITLNGISLTVVDSDAGKFSVAIIPYTYHHTSIKNIKKGDQINLEFDILGKWVREWMK